MNLGDKLRVMRAVRDVTQGELACTLGLNPSIIGKLEVGLINASAELESRIRDALCWSERDDVALRMLDYRDPEAPVYSAKSVGVLEAEG